MKGEIKAPTPDSVVGETARMAAGGYRFVTMSCVAAGNGKIDVLYHFDKDFEMKHFRLSVTEGDTIPSISRIYFAAFLVENEIQDLFGIRVEGMVIDYENTFYREKECPSSPFLSRG
jgi:ech hydrogenase subunit D